MLRFDLVVCERANHGRRWMPNAFWSFMAILMKMLVSGADA